MNSAIYKINYLVTGMTDTPGLQQYVDTKIKMLEKRLTHYTAETNEMIFDVEIGKTSAHHKSGYIFRAEINFNAGSVQLRAEAVKEDLYSAIDAAKDEMDRELRRHKSKHVDRIRHGAKRLKDMVRGWRR